MSATIDSGASRRQARNRGRLRSLAAAILLRYTVVVFLVLMIAVAAIIYPNFLSATNLRNILSQNAPVGIIAVGMTYVIIGGGFDISVGSIFAFGATLFAGLSLKMDPALAGAIVPLAGLTMGAVNGALVTLLRVNAFVATLATSFVFLGIARLYSQNQPFIVSDSAFAWLGTGEIGPVRVSIIILVVIFVVGEIVLKKTVFGRSLYAVGGNEEASRLSGIRVKLVRGTTYAITGVLSAFAGMIMASRLSLGQADMGDTMAMDAIAVVVIGGASLLGGVGSMWGTAAGLFIIAILTNLFNSLSVAPDLQLVVKGAIIAGAVAFDMYARSRRATLRLNAKGDG